MKDDTPQIPDLPGLGEELDHEAAAELHTLYSTAMVQDRDETDEILKYIHDYVRRAPRWQQTRTSK